MKILIDGQTLSTPDIHRGIGIVFSEILANLLRLGPYHEFFLAVYDDYAKDQIGDVQDAIEILRLGKKLDISKDGGIAYNDAIIHYISDKKIDCFWIPNPVMPNVNLIKKPLECKVLITFYDLIPLIFEEYYLNTWPANLKGDYLGRLRSLNEIGDWILPISNCTKNDLINLLKINPDKVQTVYLGINRGNHSRENKISDPTREKYILYVGGFDPRKNMTNSILAFKRLTKKYPYPNLKFYIVCDCDQITKDHFLAHIKDQSLLDKIVLTGYVSDRELNILYHNTELLFFPSLYEGFGLPIIEAMAAGTPVAASNRSSIPELVGDAGLLFDPEDIDDMALKLHWILSDTELKERLIFKGLQNSKKFSWEKTAKKYLEIIERFPSEDISERPHKIATAQKSKLKIAYFSPIHPQISGISQYSKELLLELKTYADIDIFLEKDVEPIEPEIINNFRYFCYVEFKKLAKTENYDAILYQIGNNSIHEYIYKISLRYPGITVLHDYVIHPFIKHITLDRGKIFSYLFEFFYMERSKKTSLIKQILLKGLDSVDLVKYPLNDRLIKASKKVIVHSRYVRNLLRGYPHVYVIPQGCYPVEYSTSDILENKAFLRIDKNHFLISVFGFMNRNKRIDVIVRVFNKLQKEFPYIRLLLVGATNIDLRDIIKDNPEKIDVLGYVSEDFYHKYLSISDIVINLRSPTMGETSRTLLDAMASGKPVIVSNIGSYKETPDNCCWKVDLDEKEEELLYQYLRELISNKKLREVMGKNGKEFITRNHDWREIAMQYIQLIEETANQTT
jgi:glycosyltransferase involved in cell wall biosynthesis